MHCCATLHGDTAMSLGFTHAAYTEASHSSHFSIALIPEAQLLIPRLWSAQAWEVLELEGLLPMS